MAKRLKFKQGELVVGRDDGPASFRDRPGIVDEFFGPGQYWVLFEDGRRECVLSNWIEASHTVPGSIATPQPPLFDSRRPHH